MKHSQLLITVTIAWVLLFGIISGASGSTKGIVTEWHNDTNTYSSVEIQISHLTTCYALFNHFKHKYGLRDYEAFEKLKYELGNIMIYISANRQFKRITSARLLKVVFKREIIEGEVGIIIHSKKSNLTDAIDEFIDSDMREILYPEIKKALSNIDKHSNYIIRTFKRSPIVEIDI